ncbi:MAG: hypothetical protein AAFO07_27455 [Bacteroidota bacterium]
MDTNNIILHNITPEQLKTMLKEMVKEEFEHINNEIQMAMGEDDLISIGTASRLLGMCKKVFGIYVKEGHFTVYYHLKERRFLRSEILDYRNRYKVARQLKI